MNVYDSLKSAKSKELKEVDDKMKALLELKPTLFTPFFEKFLFNEAKRLRPLFIFLMCDYLDFKITEEILNLAVGIEFLHSASLIHDDILDDGILRRNLPCIHKEKGMKAAVLAGDYLLSLAMESISNIKTKSVLKIISNTSYEMAKSEIKSLENRFKKPELQEYLETLKEKTSSLFVSSIKAVFEINNKEIQEDILKFTENFALCFQIKDDLNNYQNNDKNKISSDEKMGIYTLPSILGEASNFDYDIIIKTKEFLDNFIEDTKNLLKEDSEKKENFTKLLQTFKGDLNVG